MKRLVFIVLSVLIIVSFVGCGADSSSAPEDDSNSGNPESVVAVEDGETGDCESGDDVTQDVEEVESPGEPDEQPVAMEDSPQGGAQPPADGTVAPEDMGDRPTDEERPIAEDGSEMPRGVQYRQQGGGSERQMIDMASVAEELGVTE